MKTMYFKMKKPKAAVNKPVAKVKLSKQVAALKRAM